MCVLHMHAVKRLFFLYIFLSTYPPPHGYLVKHDSFFFFRFLLPLGVAAHTSRTKTPLPCCVLEIQALRRRSDRYTFSHVHSRHLVVERLRSQRLPWRGLVLAWFYL